MINSLKNLVSQVFYAPNTNKISTIEQKSEYNPFENPFIQQSSSQSYAINRPVKGGYFAGYYNGKPNIVGRRLFIEV